MLNPSPNDLSMFTGKVRVRVCGLLEEDGRLLLIKHRSIGPRGYLWAPPGGGVEFGDRLEVALAREFKEETHLTVSVDEFLFVNEFVGNKHHAIEFFYKVSKLDGELKLGTDPELAASSQILADLQFVPYAEIDCMEPEVLHNLFGEVKAAEKVFDLRGFIRFEV